MYRGQITDLKSEEKFVGRASELNEFREFLEGKRPYLKECEKVAPSLLLVVGEQGMGKSALLQEMAKQVPDKDCVFFAELDRRKDFHEQIYPIIAMAESKKCFHFDLCKVGKRGFKILDKAVPLVVPKKMIILLPFLGEWAVPAFVALAFFWIIEEVGSFLLNKTRKLHQNTGNDVNILAKHLNSALSDLDRAINTEKRIVILLDPQEECPGKIIPLLKCMGCEGIPPKVRFVIAQNPGDEVIKAVKKRQIEIRRLCAKTLDLGKMNREDSLKFIEVYDTNRKLNDITQEVFLEKYGGWPLAMGLVLEDLLHVEGEVSENYIRRMPSDVVDIWDEKYNLVKEEASRTFLDILCLLPHTYPMEKVAKFAKLSTEQLRNVCNDASIWLFLETLPGFGTYPENPLKKCPSFQHSTAKEYILEHQLKIYEDIYYDRLAKIASHYKDRVEAGFEGKTEDRDALVYVLSYMIDGMLWDDLEELLTNISFLKKMQRLDTQYLFQKDFVGLLSNEQITTNKLTTIFEGVLNTIWEQLETGQLETEEQLEAGKRKADWLDTFAYWINEFGPKDGSERSLKLSHMACEFDRRCGEVAEELSKAYSKKEEYEWALRFAELRTWVYQRSADYKKCVDACQVAETMCSDSGIDAYQYLGRAEFVRIRAYALTMLSEIPDECKKVEYESEALKAYGKLDEIFPADGGECQWPTMQEWKMLEKWLESKTDKVLPTPSKINSEEPRTFRAMVVSNLHDCISAMHVIQYLEDRGGLVDWVHYVDFNHEQCTIEDILFVILIGGPKAPGMSVANKFYKADKESFYKMYSGLHFEPIRLKTKEEDINYYWLGGVSKMNTLKAAYDFTLMDDEEVRQIVKKKIKQG